MITPREYMARYLSVPVRRTNGSVESVRVDRYRRRGFGFNEQARNALVSRLNRGLDADIELHVQTSDGPVNIVGKNHKSGVNGMKWTLMAAYAFVGKGSPEHCQVALQLADQWGLAPHGLQAYADSALGLDCNGFVGNYLWHGKLGQVWTDLGLNDQFGPDSSIGAYLHPPSRVVTRWEDIDPSRSYVMAWVHDTGAIRQGGGDTGHIVITEPDESRALTMRPWGGPIPFALRAVESTWPKEGLREGWYGFLDFDAKKKIFKIDREGLNSTFWFKIAAIANE